MVPDRATTIVVSSADPTAARAARHVADHLERSAEVHTTSAGLTLNRVLRAERAPLVVVIDAAGATVTVVRTADRTVLSRWDPGLERSPFQLALVALELLDIARDGGARGEEARGLELAVAIEASVSVVFTPGNESAVAQPTVGAALIVRHGGAPWWSSVGAQARIMGDIHRRFGDPLLGDAMVDYERFDTALRAVLGLRLGALRPAVALELGISGSNVTVEDAGGATVARDQRFEPWLAAMVEGRYALGAGFGIRLAAGAGTVVRPARYLVRGDVAIEEGTFRLIAGAGLVWEAP